MIASIKWTVARGAAAQLPARVGPPIRTIFVAASLSLAACSVPPRPGFTDVRTAVERRTGHTIFWDQGGEHDREVKEVVRGMLAREISPAEAVQIALLNNPTLQATYEDLTVAQADVVQAGLLKNPVFSGFFHAPISSGAVPHWEIGVEQDFLSVFMIPAKTRVAEAELEAVKLKVGSEVIELAYDVRAAYFTLQAAQQALLMRRMILEAAEASIDVKNRQRAGGTISELDLAQEQSVYDLARLDLAQAESSLVGARERLTRLLGLRGLDAAFRIPSLLPDLPPADPSLDHLEALAIAQRLDVAAAKKVLDARNSEVTMVKDWRWIGGFTAGGGIDRDSDGPKSIGPSGSIELPIFDQKQALIARLEAEARRAARRVEAVEINALSEVREATARVQYARATVAYHRTVVIPNRERVVQLSQVQYDAMLLGVYQLLQAKQNEVGAYRDYIDSVRDYWVARAELGKAVGGRLSATGGQP